MTTEGPTEGGWVQEQEKEEEKEEEKELELDRQLKKFFESKNIK
jgi:hypothetical protein